MKLLLLTCVLGCHLWAVQGYKTGPPVVNNPDVCTNMVPQHGVSAQSSSSPYEVVPGSTCYKDNADIPVYFRVKDGETTYDDFEGLFVQARAVSDATSVNRGTFSTSDGDLQTLSCLGTANSAVGHNKAQHWTCKKFMWRPDSGLTSDIKFHATGVNSHQTFWTAFPSAITVTYDAACVIDVGIHDETYSCTDSSASGIHGHVMIIHLVLFGVFRALL